MNAKEAADQLRPHFHLESMPAEDRHHVKFVEDVAAEFGVEPTPFNLHQVASALDAADIKGDSLEFPKMLYSRSHHAEEAVAASVYDPRHDWVWVHVANAEEATKLGSDWIENPSELPPRGDIPLHAAPKEAPAEQKVERDLNSQYDEMFARDGAKIGAAPSLREPKSDAGQSQTAASDLPKDIPQNSDQANNVS